MKCSIMLLCICVFTFCKRTHFGVSPIQRVKQYLILTVNFENFKHYVKIHVNLELSLLSDKKSSANYIDPGQPASEGAV